MGRMSMLIIQCLLISGFISTEDSNIYLLVEPALCAADGLFRATERVGFLFVGLAKILHDTEECFLGGEGRGGFAKSIGKSGINHREGLEHSLLLQFAHLTDVLTADNAVKHVHTPFRLGQLAV